MQKLPPISEILQQTRQTVDALPLPWYGDNRGTPPVEPILQRQQDTTYPCTSSNSLDDRKKEVRTTQTTKLAIKTAPAEAIVPPPPSEKPCNTDVKPDMPNIAQQNVAIAAHIEEGAATEKRFRCLTCEKYYSSSGHLTRHTKQKHLNAKKNCTCTLCPKAFWTNYDLKRHMISHSKSRPMKCQLCECDFKYKHDLSNHIRKNHNN